MSLESLKALLRGLDNNVKGVAPTLNAEAQQVAARHPAPNIVTVVHNTPSGATNAESPVTGTSVSKQDLKAHAEMLADKLAKTQKNISKQVFK